MTNFTENKSSILCLLCSSISLLIIIGLVIAIFVVNANNAALRTAFSVNASLIVDRWSNSLNASVRELQIIGAFCATFESINNQTFGGYLDRLEINNNIKNNETIIFAMIVNRSNLTTHIDSIRSEGYRNYTVFNKLAPDRQPSVDNEFLLPILYYYPPRNDAQLFGFDLLSEPSRHRIIEIANVSRSTVSTGRIFTLTSNQPLITIYEPVFVNDRLNGVLFESFLVNSLIDDSVKDFNRGTFRIVWRDLKPDEPNATIVYQSGNNSASMKPVDESHAFVLKKQFNIAQRSWEIEIQSLETDDRQLQNNIAIAMVVLSVMALAIVATTVFFVKSRMKIKQQQTTLQLLDMVVPEHISRELVMHVKVLPTGKVVLEGDTLIAKEHRQVALCFIDVCNFSILSSTMTPDGLVHFLDEFFTLIDTILDKYQQIIKIKTIGDAYFAVSGLKDTSQQEQHSSDSSQYIENLLALVEFCVKVQKAIAEHRFTAPRVRAASLSKKKSVASSPETVDTEKERVTELMNDMRQGDSDEFEVSVRIGIHCGDVVAGVVGKKQPHYDVWGNTCNIAARMESTASNGTIQVSTAVCKALIAGGFENRFKFHKKRVTLKGYGRVTVYELTENCN